MDFDYIPFGLARQKIHLYRLHSWFDFDLFLFPSIWQFFYFHLLFGTIRFFCTVNSVAIRYSSLY